MKIAIYGAGAVGGNIGARLHESGQDVTLIARGAHLAAIQQHGLKLVNTHPEAASETVMHISATDAPATLPKQDVVILSCKSYDIPAAAVAIQPLLGADTIVIPVANGVPWWFTSGISGKLDGLRIAALDPDNLIPRHIAPERVIGGLVYMGSAVLQPGVVACYDKRPRIVIGEPCGGTSERAEYLKTLFYNAGFSTTASTNIRSDVWNKLCWNIAFNPLSVLTGLTSHALATQEPQVTTIRAVMQEMAQLAGAMQLDISVDVEAQMQAALRSPGHKTSMLQDFEGKKALEIPAIIGAAVEISQHLGVATPHIHHIYTEISKFS